MSDLYRRTKQILNELSKNKKSSLEEKFLSVEPYSSEYYNLCARIELEYLYSK